MGEYGLQRSSLKESCVHGTTVIDDVVMTMTGVKFILASAGGCSLSYLVLIWFD